MRNSHYIRILANIVAVVAIAGMAMAQGTTYHLKVVPESQPTGPNEVFYAKVILVEHSSDVLGYQVQIGYDNTRAKLLSGIDNTGQPTASTHYTVGGEQALTGVSYANVYCVLLVDTIYNLLPPVNPADDFNLGRLKFQTTAGYNVADGEFGIYLNKDTVGGVLDGTYTHLDVTYVSYAPGSAVSDWAIY